MSVKRVCCDVIGVITTSLSAILLLCGFILILLFSEDFDESKDWSSVYSIGIVAIVLGTVTSMLATVYLCIALRRGWKLYGCVTVNAPSKAPSVSMAQLPSKDELDNNTSDAMSSSSHAGHVVTDAQPTSSSSPSGRVTAYDIQRQESKRASTEWNPDTVLQDDDMY